MDDHNLCALVIDSLRDPILVVDATGEVELANPAAIRLLELAGGGGDAAHPRHGLDAAAVMELIRRAERARGPISSTAGEGDRGVAIDVDPMPAPPGARRRWILRVRAPETLEREIAAERAIADVAHEIKNPITAMLNALGALPVPAGDVSSPAVAAGRAARAVFERSVRRLARLVSGLLDLSRVREGVATLERTSVDVRPFISRSVDDFRALHPAARDRIACEIHDDVGEAFVDPDRVEQALWNLLSNAVRFAPREESVVVRVTCAGVECVDEDLRLVPWDAIGHPRLLRIDVEDNGLGMTSETLDHLFDRHHDPGALAGGAHLGLNITRALVDVHDGWLQVESRLGEGTLVSAFLPRDAQSAGILSKVRAAQREARRRWLAHRATAVVVIRKTRPASWLDVAGSWTVPARFDSREALSPRDSAFWSLSDVLAVGLTPLADASGDPSSAIGAPLLAIDEGAWMMDGFVAGWCGDRERVSFAQAFHRAASRMSRALADGACVDGVETEAGPASGMQARGPAVEP